MRQHSSMRVTNASGNLALHKMGIRESLETGNHALTHLLDGRYGKPRVLHHNLRRNLRRKCVSVNGLSVSECVCVCVCVFGSKALADDPPRACERAGACGCSGL